MSTDPSTSTQVSENARKLLTGLAVGDGDVLELVGLQESEREATGLDTRAFAVAKIAVLVALDAPPASYMFQVTNALANGVTPEDILGVLLAIAPQVGLPRVVAAAPELMFALGLSLPDEQGVPAQRAGES
jgi:alkylhydroperoxidase/carboxymuconolactone decarboxylase family protein YurZ